MKSLLLPFALLTLLLAGCGPEKIENVTLQWHPFAAVSPLFPLAPKPLFLFVTEKGCDFCEAMDSLVFSRPEVADFVNKNFYAVRVDVATDMPIKIQDTVLTESQFRKLLRVEGTPAYYFFDSNGRTVGALDSQMDLLMFKRMLVYIKNDHFMRTPWDDFLKLPEADLDTVRGVF
jgi:thioredoxin-related protein